VRAYRDRYGRTDGFSLRVAMARPTFLVGHLRDNDNTGIGRQVLAHALRMIQGCRSAAMTHAFIFLAEQAAPDGVASRAPSASCAVRSAHAACARRRAPSSPDPAVADDLGDLGMAHPFGRRSSMAKGSFRAAASEETPGAAAPSSRCRSPKRCASWSRMPGQDGAASRCSIRQRLPACSPVASGMQTATASPARTRSASTRSP